MAIRNDGVWEVRPGGNQNNGSVFSSALGGTDYTLQDAAQATFADGTGNGTTTLASVSNPFTAAMVGNGVGIIEGATYQGVWQITAFIGAGSVTVDRNLPAGGAMTCSVGGANLFANNGVIFIGDGGSTSGYMPGNKIWIKGPGADAGDYAISSNSLTFSTVATATNPITWEGYTTTRGDNGRPTLRHSSGAINVVLVSGNFNIVKNLVLDGGSGASFALATSCANGYFENLVAKNTAPCRVATNGGNFFKRCRFTSSDAGAAGLELQSASNQFVECTFDTNTGSGVDVDDIGFFRNCLFYGNTLDGVSYSDAGDDFGFHLMHCDVWNNGRDGVRISSTASDGGLANVVIQGCILGSHDAGYDVNYTVGDISTNTGVIEWMATHMECNAFYTTGLGKYQNLPANSGDTTLSASPFTSDTDFTLNNTAGAGALVRSSNCGAVFADSTTSGGLTQSTGSNSGSYPMGALGEPDAPTDSATRLSTMRSLWREYTNENNSTVVPDATVDIYLQSGLEELNRRIQYHWETQTITLVAGTQEYSDLTDVVLVEWVEWNGRALTKADANQWRKSDPHESMWRSETAGEPREWAHEGQRLLLRPTPSAEALVTASTMTVRAITQPPSITTYGPEQLSLQDDRVPVYWGVYEWCAAHPDTELAVHRCQQFMKLFDDAAARILEEYRARRVGR